MKDFSIGMNKTRHPSLDEMAYRVWNKDEQTAGKQRIEWAGVCKILGQGKIRSLMGCK
jgi:hypothetical protein